METFSLLQALCEGKSPVTGGFPSQRAVMPSFDFFFVLRLDKRLRKQSRPGWFEKSSLLLWHHSDVLQENIHDARVLSMNFGCKKTIRDVSRCVKVRNNNIDDKIHISKLAESLLWIGACLFHPLTPSPSFRDHFVYASFYFSDMGTLVWLSQCH